MAFIDDNGKRYYSVQAAQKKAVQAATPKATVTVPRVTTPVVKKTSAPVVKTVTPVAKTTVTPTPTITQQYQNTINDANNTAPTTPNTDQNYATMQDYINQMYKAQEDAKIQQLAVAKAKALAGYSTQRDTANTNYQNSLDELNTMYNKALPTFAQQANDADYQGVRSLMANKEQMAVNGLYNSGENQTANAMINAARQGAVNDINVSKNNYLSDIDNQKAAVSRSKLDTLNEIANQIALLESNNASEEDIAKSELAAQRISDSLGLMKDKNAELWTKYNALSNANQQKLQNTLGGLTFGYGVSQDQLAQNNWQKQFDTSNSQWQQEFNNNNYWKQKELAASQARAAASAAKSSSKYNYKNDSDFQSDLAYASTNGNSLAEIKAKASDLISKYGVDGYNALLTAASKSGY